jgi:hypothetical protein
LPPPTETEATAKKKQGEEAAAAKRREEEARAVVTPGTGGVSLDGTSVTVQGYDVALVKLNCLGILSCRGKLTVTAKITVKVTGKKTHTVSIGTVSFLIAGDETKTVKIDLDAVGRAVLKADHGRASASLEILELAPSLANTQRTTVQLVQQKAAKGKKR